MADTKLIQLPDSSGVYDGTVKIERNVSGDMVLTDQNAGSKTLSEFGGLTEKSATLNDDTSSPTLVTGASWPTASIRGVRIDYHLIRDGDLQQGTLFLSHEGGAARVPAREYNFDNVGVDFTADINTGNLRLLYTTTDTGDNVTMKFYVKEFSI